VPSYLVEAYLADTPAALANARARAHLAAETDEHIHHVRTTFLPTDEMVLHMFNAPSDDAVRRAARRVDLPHQRIVEAFERPQVTEVAQ
jgi:hypothetical protein